VTTHLAWPDILARRSRSDQLSTSTPTVRAGASLTPRGETIAPGTAPPGEARRTRLGEPRRACPSTAALPWVPLGGERLQPRLQSPGPRPIKGLLDRCARRRLRRLRTSRSEDCQSQERQVVGLPTLHNEFNLSQVLDSIQRISRDGHEVGEFATL